MRMNITKVIEFLNHTRGSVEISIDRYSRISFSSKDREVTIDQFQKIISQWNLFQKLEMKKRAELIDDLENLKWKHQGLTVGKVRSVYRKVVENNYDQFDPLSKIEWVGYKGSLEDRVIIKKKADALDVAIENVWFETWRPDKLDQNRRTIELYLSELNQKWGKARVNRALGRCGIDLNQMISEGGALKVLETRIITMSLIDMHQNDIEESYQRILDFAYEKGTLPGIEMEGLKRELHRDSECDLRKALKQRFTLQTTLLEDLNPLLYNFVLSISRPTQDEVITSFFGQPIEGVISGHQEDDRYRFWFSYSKDLQERLQLNETILRLNERVRN